MGALGRSFNIFSQSFALLKKDKELLLFPILSGVFCILALAGMIFGGVWTWLFGSMFKDVIGGNGNGAEILGYLFVAVWYFVSWFIVIFFNVAIVACAKIRLEGGDPVLADGFRAGFDNLGRIAGWAAVSMIVGLLLDAIERVPRIGRLLRMLIGTAWGVLTYFVVPVMIFEKTGPFASIKQSKELLRRTWGESLAGSMGLGFVIFLLMIPAFGLLYLGASAGAGAVTFIVFGVYTLSILVLGSALSGIYRTALYVYATTGQVPAGFDELAIRSSFAPRATGFGAFG